MATYLKNKLQGYIKDNSFSRKTNDNGDVVKYQKSLKSTVIETSERLGSDSIYVSPLNSATYQTSLNVNIFLSSLSSDKNKFTVDRENLIKLFKSSTGILDLPYSFLLYLGYISNHTFYTPESFQNMTLPIGDILNNLDGNKNGDFKLIRENGKYSPDYGSASDNTSIYNPPSIQVMTDATYRSGYTSKFIPKFGYGTFSKHMQHWYDNVINGSNPLIKSLYSEPLKPFHIYGAENGFVKSFKTYKKTEKIDLNFMGHFTILKNKYDSPITPKTTLISEYQNIIAKYDFKNIVFGLNSTYAISKTDLLSIFLIYSKIKTAYITNQTEYNGTNEILDLVKKLNSGKKITVFGSEIGSFTYIVFYYFFNEDFNVNFRNISEILNIFDIPVMYRSSDDDTRLNNFLIYQWDREKSYIESMNDNFDPNRTLSSKFVAMLYPSAGGDFNAELTLDLSKIIMTDMKIDTRQSENSSFILSGNQTSLNKNRKLKFDKSDKTHINQKILESGYFPTDDQINPKFWDSLKTNTDRNKNLFLIFKNQDDLLTTNFDNARILENSCRMLWYDTAHNGKNMFCRDIVNNKYNQEKFVNTNLYDICSNFNSENFLVKKIYKDNSGRFNPKKANNLNMNELYEIIDVEKLRSCVQQSLYFVESDPSKQNTARDNNNNNFLYYDLLKGMTTIDEDDIAKQFSTGSADGIINSSSDLPYLKTLDDFIYLMNGYSSYNYYFASEFGLSAIINAILTGAQYDRVESPDGVLDVFLSQKMSLNNYSTIGSVSTSDTNYTQYHRYILRPDVVLGLGNDALLDNQELLPYYFRAFVFGDNTPEKYSGEVTDSTILSDVNEYLYLKFDSDGHKFSQSTAVEYIRFFFEFIDVQYTHDNFLLLHPYIVRFFDESGVRELVKIPDYPVIKKFLASLVDTFYKNQKNAVNTFLLHIKDKLSTDYLNPTGANSFYDKQKDYDQRLDAKIKTYYNIKNIYDKYMSYQKKDVLPIETKYVDTNYVNSEFDLNQGMLFYNFLYKDISLDSSIGSSGEKSKFNEDTPKHLCEYVQIVDRANNNIGDKILIDIVSLSEKIKLDKGGDNKDFLNRTVYNIFDIIASDNDFILHPINSFVDQLSTLKTDGGTVKYTDTLFGLHTTTDRVQSNPAFILQWIDKSSSVVDKKNDLTQKPLTNSFTLDISSENRLPLNESEIPEDIKNGNVTSFVVDFTNKNQNMFKNIQLNTSEFANTEESINAVVALAADKGNQSNTIVSGNLFRMMEQRSYTCQVESMGNAMIQPLTYFYLKNVPLFKGAYWITNVEHKLNINGMTTTFKGVRQPNVAKTTNEKEILMKIEDTLEKIKKDSPSVQTNNKTKGTITQNRFDESHPYGLFYQPTVNGYDTPEFYGKQILASLIKSEFGSDAELCKLFVAVLYNRAKSMCDGEKIPKNIIRYMVDVAVQLQTNYSGSELKTYFDEYSGKFGGSLSELTIKHFVDEENDISKLLNSLAKARDASEVSTILTPKIPQQQILKITTPGNGVQNFTPGNNVQGSNIPEINYTEVNTSPDLTASWEAFNIIYMKYVDKTREQKNSIYVTNVNNENLKQYEVFNKFIKTPLVSGYVKDDLIFLGCYGRDQGITFFGKLFTGDNKDNYNPSTVIKPLNIVNRNVTARKSTISSTEMKKNKLIVKTLLKNGGLTKQQVAAIMGNIEKESHFNPTEVSPEENNTSRNYGLVQYNTNSYSGGKKTIQGVQETVGVTVKSQIDYLLTVDVVKEFVQRTANMTDPYDIAMIFAKKFEVCVNCFEKNKKTESLWSITAGDRTTFKSDLHYRPYERGEFAIKYFNQLNDPTNELYWENNNSQLIVDKPAITIGDSLSVLVHDQNNNITRYDNLSVKGWHLTELVKALQNTTMMDGYSSVVLSIGVNDGWEETTNIAQAANLIKEKLPNAKYYILNGHYGWGLTKKDGTKTDAYWTNKINTYINKWKNSGFNIIGKITEEKEHPTVNDTFFKTFANDLKNL